MIGVLETAAVITMAGLISAWAAWAYPALKGRNKVTRKTMVFTQDQCTYSLIPTSVDHGKGKQTQTNNGFINEEEKKGGNMDITSNQKKEN